MNKDIKPTKTYLNQVNGGQKSCFSKQILQDKNNMKKKCSVAKQIIGKMYQDNKSNLPWQLFVDRKYITLEKRES